MSDTTTAPAPALTLRGGAWRALDLFRARERMRYNMDRMDRVALLPARDGLRAWGIDAASVAVATDGKAMILVPVDTPAGAGATYDPPKVGAAKRATTEERTAGALPLGSFPPVDSATPKAGDYLPGVSAPVDSWRALFACAETATAETSPALALAVRLYLPAGSGDPTRAGARVEARGTGDAASPVHTDGVKTVAELRAGPQGDTLDAIGLDANLFRRALDAAPLLARAASSGRASGAVVTVRPRANHPERAPLAVELRAEAEGPLLALAVVMPMNLG